MHYFLFKHRSRAFNVNWLIGYIAYRKYTGFFFQIIQKLRILRYYYTIQRMISTFDSDYHKSRNSVNDGWEEKSPKDWKQNPIFDENDNETTDLFNGDHRMNSIFMTYNMIKNPYENDTIQDFYEIHSMIAHKEFYAKIYDCDPNDLWNIIKEKIPVFGYWEEIIEPLQYYREDCLKKIRQHADYYNFGRALIREKNLIATLLSLYDKYHDENDDNLDNSDENQYYGKLYEMFPRVY